MQVLGGRYELTGLLGRGGMAEVHCAHDRLLDRLVAVKLLLDPGPGDVGAARQRFDSEARLLAQLEHPALVRLLDAGTSTGRPYFVMELVEGRPLSQHLTGEPLDPALVARIGSRVAAGLAHAHDRGIVHRDVKPANVLVGEDGTVRLADFGIARLLGDTTGVTGTGNAVGTVAYLAPEQVRGERATPAVDVYALGLMLLEALTGARAFPGTSTESAFARLHHSPTIPLSLPHGWPRLLAAMTAADAAARPSAAEAATALEALADGRSSLEHLPPADPTLDSPRTQATPSAPPLRRVPRHRLVAAAAAVVLAAFAGGAALTPEPAVSDERTETPGDHPTQPPDREREKKPEKQPQKSRSEKPIQRSEESRPAAPASVVQDRSPTPAAADGKSAGQAKDKQKAPGKAGGRASAPGQQKKSGPPAHAGGRGGR